MLKFSFSMITISSSTATVNGMYVSREVLGTVDGKDVVRHIPSTENGEHTERAKKRLIEVRKKFSEPHLLWFTMATLAINDLFDADKFNAPAYRKLLQNELLHVMLYKGLILPDQIARYFPSDLKIFIEKWQERLHLTGYRSELIVPNTTTSFCEESEKNQRPLLQEFILPFLLRHGLIQLNHALEIPVAQWQQIEARYGTYFAPLDRNGAASEAKKMALYLRNHEQVDKLIAQQLDFETVLEKVNANTKITAEADTLMDVSTKTNVLLDSMPYIDSPYVQVLLNLNVIEPKDISEMNAQGLQGLQELHETTKNVPGLPFLVYFMQKLQSIENSSPKFVHFNEVMGSYTCFALFSNQKISLANVLSLPINENPTPYQLFLRREFCGDTTLVNIDDITSANFVMSHLTKEKSQKNNVSSTYVPKHVDKTIEAVPSELQGLSLAHLSASIQQSFSADFNGEMTKFIKFSIVPDGNCGFNTMVSHIVSGQKCREHLVKTVQNNLTEALAARFLADEMYDLLSRKKYPAWEAFDNEEEQLEVKWKRMVREIGLNYQDMNKLEILEHLSSKNDASDGEFYEMYARFQEIEIQRIVFRSQPNGICSEYLRALSDNLWLDTSTARTYAEIQGIRLVIWDKTGPNSVALRVDNKMENPTETIHMVASDNNHFDVMVSEAECTEEIRTRYLNKYEDAMRSAFLKVSHGKGLLPQHAEVVRPVKQISRSIQLGTRIKSGEFDLSNYDSFMNSVHQVVSACCPDEEPRSSIDPLVVEFNQNLFMCGILHLASLNQERMVGKCQIRPNADDERSLYIDLEISRNQVRCFVGAVNEALSKIASGTPLLRHLPAQKVPNKQVFSLSLDRVSKYFNEIRRGMTAYYKDLSKQGIQKHVFGSLQTFHDISTNYKRHDKSLNIEHEFLRKIGYIKPIKSAFSLPGYGFLNSRINHEFFFEFENDEKDFTNLFLFRDLINQYLYKEFCAMGLCRMYKTRRADVDNTKYPYTFSMNNRVLTVALGMEKQSLPIATVVRMPNDEASPTRTILDNNRVDAAGHKPFYYAGKTNQWERFNFLFNEGAYLDRYDDYVDLFELWCSAIQIGRTDITKEIEKVVGSEFHQYLFTAKITSAWDLLTQLSIEDKIKLLEKSPNVLLLAAAGGHSSIVMEFLSAHIEAETPLNQDAREHLYFGQALYLQDVASKMENKACAAEAYRGALLNYERIQKSTHEQQVRCIRCHVDLGDVLVNMQHFDEANTQYQLALSKHCSFPDIDPDFIDEMADKQSLAESCDKSDNKRLYEVHDLFESKIADEMNIGELYQLCSNRGLTKKAEKRVVATDYLGSSASYYLLDGAMPNAYEFIINEINTNFDAVMQLNKRSRGLIFYAAACNYPSIVSEILLMHLEKNRQLSDETSKLFYLGQEMNIRIKLRKCNTDDPLGLLVKAELDMEASICFGRAEMLPGAEADYDAVCVLTDSLKDVENENENENGNHAWSPNFYKKTVNTAGNTAVEIEDSHSDLEMRGMSGR